MPILPCSRADVRKLVPFNRDVKGKETAQVIECKEWTPKVVADRQSNLMKIFEEALAAHRGISYSIPSRIKQGCPRNFLEFPGDI